MSNSSPLRLVVAGDQSVDPLCRTIASWPMIEIVGRAQSTQEAGRLAAALNADLVLLALDAPGIDGQAAIPQVKTRPDGPMVFVLSSKDSPDDRTGAFAAGADGFLSTTGTEQKLRTLLAKIRPLP